MSEARTIILHYHLFKNAGTSVDAILESNFGANFVTREFPPMGGNNTPAVEAWIRDTPDAIAYSSHTMIGPFPRVDDVRIISFMLLRDPISRILSAYKFERKQNAQTFGARLAKKTDFEGYVRACLEMQNHRQCRNFHTSRLASMVQCDASEVECAIEAAKSISVIGFVEDFSKSMMRLCKKIEDVYPCFSFENVHLNSSSTSDSELEMKDELKKILIDSNEDDFYLISHLKDLKC